MRLAGAVVYLAAVIAVVAVGVVNGTNTDDEKTAPLADTKPDALADLIESNDYVVVLFYDTLGGPTESVVQAAAAQLGRYEVPVVKVRDRDLAAAAGLKQLPGLVVFDNGVPQVFEKKLDNPSEVKEWIIGEVKRDDVDVVDLDVLNKLTEQVPALLVLFVEDESQTSSEAALRKLCTQLDIAVAKVLGMQQAQHFGFQKLPAFVYFESGISTFYDAESGAEQDQQDSLEDLLEWVEVQRTADTIEKVSEEMLRRLSHTVEYLAVFFTGPCDERAKTDQQCRTVLANLENIDDDLDEFGLGLVTVEEIKYAGRELNVRKFPALGLFRNGNFLLHSGSLVDEWELFAWLIDEETLDIPGQIEKVSTRMLKKLLQEEERMLVLFYDGKNTSSNDLLELIESVDDRADDIGLKFVACAHASAAQELLGDGVDLPAVVLFENELPSVYPFTGQALAASAINQLIAWAKKVYESDSILAVNGPLLERVLANVDNLVVVFYEDGKKSHDSLLDELKPLSEDLDKLEMRVVSSDLTKASSPGRKLGLSTAMPSVILFTERVPNVFDGDLTYEAILHWLHDQKLESHIKRVTGSILQELITSQAYLVVLFLNNCESSEECDNILAGLETVDDELEKLGILFVYTEDEKFAKKLAIDDFPTLVYYRNGDLLLYDGNIESDVAVLRFLTDIDNILLSNKIEEVDKELLEHLVQESPHIFAFLYSEASKRSKKIIKKLEGINDNLENDNTVLVKCSDLDVADDYGVGYVPRLLYFENFVPEAFKGDLGNEAQVLKWISEELSQDEIKAVSRSVLERLIAKHDGVGVIFVDDEDEDEVQIITELETIHDELMERKILLVQIDDTDFEEELGLQNLPVLVHFSNDIPSIFSGPETKEDILAWLIKTETEDIIEEVTPQILGNLRLEKPYLCVFFGGECTDDTCVSMVNELETLDGVIAKIGIDFVWTRDVDYGLTHHAIHTLPALGLYRNGHFKAFEGSLGDLEQLRSWLMERENLDLPNSVESINSAMLAFLYETDNSFVVLFYESTHREADEIVEALEKIDEEMEKINVTLVKINNAEAGEQYGVTDIPALVYIQKGIPNTFDGSLIDSNEMLTWVRKETKTTRILEVTDIVLAKLVDKFDFLAAIFYDMDEDPVIDGLQSIASSCQDNDIALVKIHDNEEAKKFGLEDLPRILVFHEKMPSLLVADLDDEEEVLDWMLKKKTSSVIEDVTDQILKRLILSHEYVAVFFRNRTDESAAAIVAQLETIDDDLDAIGITLVTTADTDLAIEKGIDGLPAVGLFRNGHFVQYPEEEIDEKHVLKWMTDEETLKIIGIIDEVNIPMLENILNEEDNAVVFFYEEEDATAYAILEELEQE